MEASVRFLRELRRRKVVRAGIGYAIVGWLVLQIAEVTFEPLGIPPRVLSILIMLVALGLPAVLVLAWIYELTGEGLRRESVAAAGGTDTVGRAETARAAPAEPPSRNRPRAIAVLPFVDMSPQQDHAHFGDGIAEEILNTLSRIPALRLASRTSTFRFRGEADIRAIGRELEVDSVLEGSVRKSAGRLRVMAQLIDVSTGYHLWSERFDAVAEDIFAVQDTIARSIANALELELNADQQTARQSATSKDPQAYELYLSGWRFFHRQGRKNFQFARQLFEEAIEVDPGFARAWAGLADCYAFLYMYIEPNQTYRDKARNASKRALRLAPDLAEARVSRALALALSERFDEAEREYEHAIELEPCLFEAWYFYGRMRMHQGDFAAAVPLLERASRCRPEDFQAPLLLRQMYVALGRDEDAGKAARRGIDAADQHLRMNPDDIRALYLSSLALLWLGDREAGRERADHALAIEPDDVGVLYNVACFYVLYGEHERALDYLERAVRPAPLLLALARSDPDFSAVREHPRFAALAAGDDLRSAAGSL
ncbi:MAG: TPR end-of-group domain-containing protein [Gammaproteobacteria bacterium]